MEIILGALHSADGSVSGGADPQSPGRPESSHTEAHRVAETAGVVAVLAEPLPQRGAVDADRLGNLAHRLAGLISAVKIVKVERREYSGHVYNLQTEQGWFIAGGIVTHNCRRDGIPIVVTDVNAADDEGEE
jgi:hypothetical protein